MVEALRIAHEMPFTDHGCLVAILLEKFRESQLVAVESGGVVDESVGMAVLACQHTSTARTTDGVGYETVGESYTFITDTVDVRRMDVALVVRTDSLVRMVITHDVDDVHLFLSFCFLVGFARGKRSEGCCTREGVKQRRG